MPTFDCLVDTTPMADVVNSISGHVVGTTSAVTAMQVAVIASEKEAADNICKNVDRGFFGLIRSQVSAKVAKHFTEMNAKMMLLMEFSKSLANMQARMEADVSRLRRQYYKIFHELDKALENRVFQLDSDVMNLARARKALITERILTDISESICSERDTTNTAQLAFSARLRKKTHAALNQVGTNILENCEYNRQMSQLLDRQEANELQNEYVPIAYSIEQSMVASNSSFAQVFLPSYLGKKEGEMMRQGVMNSFDTLATAERNGEEQGEVRKEFISLLQNTNLDPRIAKTMYSLYERGRGK